MRVTVVATGLGERRARNEPEMRLVKSAEEDGNGARRDYRDYEQPTVFRAQSRREPAASRTPPGRKTRSSLTFPPSCSDRRTERGACLHRASTRRDGRRGARPRLRSFPPRCEGAGSELILRALGQTCATIFIRPRFGGEARAGHGGCRVRGGAPEYDPAAYAQELNQRHRRRPAYRHEGLPDPPAGRRQYRRGVSTGGFFRTGGDQGCPQNVGETTLSTTLVKDGVRVSTVEHLLSAMAGLGVDNAYVDLSAAEVPIMDGSAGPFVFLIQSAGIEEQNAPKRFIRILRKVSVRDGDKSARSSPSTDSRSALPSSSIIRSSSSASITPRSTFPPPPSSRK